MREVDERKKAPIYRAFGLHIQCELAKAREFGLEVCENVVPDVCILITKVPEELPNATYKDAYISAAEGCILINIKCVARYLIVEGKEIRIEIEPGARLGDVTTIAFGTAIAAILYQRDIIALHGSAVRTKKGAVIFTGNHGAGKSTTAAALATRGWEFLSDDVCAIHLDNDRPLLHLGLSRAKLARDSYTNILGHTPIEPPISEAIGKYGVAFSRNQKPTPLYAICVLEANEGELEIEQVNGTDKLSQIVNNTYRPLIHSLAKQDSQRFNQFSRITANTHVFRISRPLDYTRMDDFLEQIEEKILG